MKKKIKYFLIWCVSALVLYIGIMVATHDSDLSYEINTQLERLEKAETLDELNAIYLDLDQIRLSDSLGVYSLKLDSINDLRSACEKRIEAKKTESNSIAAYVMACEQVKKRLKSPATAKFQQYHDGVTVSNPKSGIYKVRLYVDAQNSYGVVMRNRYQVSLSNPNSDSWLLGGITKLN